MISFGLTVCATLLALPQEPVQPDGLSPLQATQELSLLGVEVDPPSREKGLFPWLARDAHGRISASWTEPRTEKGHALLWAERQSDGSWSQPIEIAAGKDWFVNWADHPMHAVDEQGRIFASWLQKVPGSTYSYHVQTRMRDLEGSWGATTILHDDRSASEHGFASIAPVPGGGFVVAWLDGQATPNKGPMQLRARRVLSNGSFGPELLVDARVCDCCGTSLRRSPDGSFALSFRDRSLHEVRDLGRARIRLFGDEELQKEPMPSPVDGWVMPGCPVNGPAQAADDKRVATTWFTMEPTPRIRLGYGFQVFTLAEGPGVAGRVSITSTKRGFAIAWLETRKGQTSWWLQEMQRKPAPTPSGDGAQILEPLGAARPLAQITGSRADGFLRLAATNSGVLAIWTEGKSQQLRAKLVEKSP